MKLTRLAAFGLGTVLALSSTPAHAWWSVGVGIGVPGCYHRPCYGYWGGYYRPYPLIVPTVVVGAAAPPPPTYIVQPAPVVVAQPAAVVQPVPAVQSNAPPSPAPSSSEELAPPGKPVSAVQPVTTTPPLQPVSVRAGGEERQVEISQYLRQLSDPDEGVRMQGVTQLGRLKAHRAVDALAATLAGDRSPAVREAAARSLGIIGTPKALPALQRAARADSDHDVRRSAQFSIEIIQAK